MTILLILAFLFCCTKVGRGLVGIVWGVGSLIFHALQLAAVPCPRAAEVQPRRMAPAPKPKAAPPQNDRVALERQITRAGLDITNHRVRAAIDRTHSETRA